MSDVWGYLLVLVASLVVLVYWLFFPLDRGSALTSWVRLRRGARQGSGSRHLPPTHTGPPRAPDLPPGGDQQ